MSRGKQVLFDGNGAARSAATSWRGPFAAVDPGHLHVRRAIRDNLTLWTARSPRPTWCAPARCVYRGDIDGRIGGYDARAEESAATFSGGPASGEIARALVPNPSVLVLDEATSALDPATEKEIDDNLRAAAARA